jgi:hypothetical protein
MGNTKIIKKPYFEKNAKEVLKVFKKSLVFLDRTFRKTYIISLNLIIQSINYSAFESRHFTLFKKLKIEKFDEN